MEITKNTYNIRKLIVFAFFVFLCSCAKDPTERPDIFEDDGILVKVSMRLKVPAFDSPRGAITKGTSLPNQRGSFNVNLVEGTELVTRSSGTTSLYNLWVCQFSADGAARKITKLPNVPEAVKDMITIDAELLTGNDQTIYLVALGKQYPDIDLKSVSNISALENYTLDFIKYENGLAVPIITKDEDIPYRGSQSGLNIVQIEKGGRGLIEYSSTSNFSGAIPIYAMVSKITIDFSFENVGFSPNMLTLNNIPITYTINNPAYKSNVYATMPAVVLDANDFKGGGRKSISWYVSPNPQGVVEGLTSEYNRYYYYDTWTKPSSPSFQGNAALVNATYINFWAKEDAAINNYAIYYIFLGGNNTDDINILAHNHYNLISDINTTNSANDLRIVYRTLAQTIDFGSSMPTKGVEYPGQMFRIGRDYDLDSHADMRPIEVCALRGSVTVEILESDAQDATPINKSVSWLKLSSYSNYTEACEKDRIGDRDGFSTSITREANIPGIFKFYLYSDEYEKYVYGNDPRETDTRSLYIRFTFNNGKTKDITTTQIIQRPGLYMGRFGGDFNKATGEYSKGIVFESVKELYTGVKYLSYHQYGVAIARGLYVGTYELLCNEYKVGEMYNGKEPSYYAAINEKGYALKYVGSQYKYPEAPRYINGKLDLNQYSINKRNYFSARYCFDKNRDTNGDGYIKGDEIVWYYPAYFQGRSVLFNLFNTSIIPFIGKIWPYTDIQSISQIAENKVYATNIYNSVLYQENYDYISNMPVCVRDVELPSDSKFPGGIKVSNENGYAVIDATGMDAGSREDRGKNPSLILRADKRVIRHFYAKGSNASNKTLSSCLSSRFAVAPYDIDINGNQRTYERASSGLMTWADASGFMEVGNSFVMNVELDPRDVGCPVYGGNSGVEKGQWRLPTESEIIVISMMDATMSSASLITNYVPLLDSQDPNAPTSRYVYYWTSSETQPNTEGSVVGYAAALLNSHSLSGGVLASKTRAVTYGLIKTNKSFVRCIKDLP